MLVLIGQPSLLTCDLLEQTVYFVAIPFYSSGSCEAISKLRLSRSPVCGIAISVMQCNV
jgi:hypothetical protein